MNKIIITAKLNGMWKNGLTGEKRGLNIFLVDYSTIFKTTVWQETADWAEEQWSIGDEIQLSGECSGIWENNYGKAIEIKKPQIISVNTTRIEMKELTKQFKLRNNNDNEEENSHEHHDC